MYIRLKSEKNASVLKMNHLFLALFTRFKFAICDLVRSISLFVMKPNYDIAKQTIL